MVLMPQFTIRSFTLNQRKKILYLNIKRSQSSLKKIIDLLVFFQIFPRFTKDACMIKCQVTLKIFFQNINAVLVRVTVRSIAY